MSFHLQASHTRSSFFPSSFLFTHETSVYATSSSTRCTKAFHGAGKSLIDTHMMKKQQKFFVYSFRHRHTERKTFPTRPNFFLLRSLNILFSPPPSEVLTPPVCMFPSFSRSFVEVLLRSCFEHFFT